MKKHTKGKVEQSHRMIGELGYYSTQVYTSDTVICTLDWAGHKDGKTTTSRREGNANLILHGNDVLVFTQRSTVVGKEPTLLQNKIIREY